MTSARCILFIFDSYQKAKINFLQNIYDYTVKKDLNVDQLLDLNVMEQVFPLLSDAPNVQSLALTTTVKLCANSEDISRQILEKKLICHLGTECECQSKDFKRNVLHIVKNISKYPDLTQQVLTQAKCLMTTSIHDVDTLQREFVLAALTNIANYSVCNAQQVMDLRVLPQVVLCLQCPVSLALEATQLVKALCKQSVDITGVLLDYNVLTHLADNLNSNDVKLTRQTLLCLAEIAKHCQDFAEKVMTDRVLCKTILCTSHCDINVKKGAAMLMKELSKYDVDLSKTIVQHGALAGLINIIGDTNPSVKIPAIMTLGYMAAQSDQLALAIIHSQGLQELITALHSETSEATLSALVWTIEQLTKHSAHHVTFLNNSNVFARLLRIYLTGDSCPELRTRCLSALQNTVNKCLNIQDIDLLLYESPTEILLPAVRQLCKIFAVDPRARRVFVSSGGLKRVQSLAPTPGSELCEAVTMLNSHFPEDIVRYYSPRFSETMIAPVEKFKPNIPLSDIRCGSHSISTLSLSEQQ